MRKGLVALAFSPLAQAPVGAQIYYGREALYWLAIGLIHESGHYTAARLCGFRARIVSPFATEVDFRSGRYSRDKHRVVLISGLLAEALVAEALLSKDKPGKFEVELAARIGMSEVGEAAAGFIYPDSDVWRLDELGWDKAIVAPTVASHGICIMKRAGRKRSALLEKKRAFLRLLPIPQGARLSFLIRF